MLTVNRVTFAMGMPSIAAALKLCGGVGLTLGLLANPGSGQRPHGPTFEVVSIRVDPPGSRVLPGQPGPLLPGGKYLDRHATLWSLIVFAHPEFSFPNQTIVGLPPWGYGRPGAFFDFEAEAPAKAAGDLPALQAMMDAALAERFHLRYHTESRSMPVLFLEVGPGGPRRLKPSPPGAQSFALRFAGGGVIGRGATMDELAAKVGAYFEDRPVINRTGLTGYYDFDTQSATGELAGRPGRKEMIASEIARLGLRLVPGNAEVRVMIVDNAAMPTGN